MKVIGITGGVGSGKSTVLGIIEANYKSRIVICDQVGQMLQEKGNESYRLIAAYFGSQILNENGDIDRQKLASIVFQDKSELEMLNSFVHPQVMRYVDEELMKERTRGEIPFFFIESAILFEAGYEDRCDEVWYIRASSSVRRERLKAGRGYTDEKIDTILSNQMAEEEFSRRCTYIIDNNGDTEYLMVQLRSLLH